MDKKMGPTEMLAEIERLKAAVKMPSLEQVLAAVADVRQKYVPKILAARKQGSMLTRPWTHRFSNEG